MRKAALFIGAVALAAGLLQVPAGATEVRTFTNPAPISFSGVGPASPYPSEIVVSGMDAPIIDVTVTLNGITHSAPDDIDVLLESPSGERVVFFSDIGGTIPVEDVTVTLAGGSGVFPADDGPLTSGTFIPTNYFPHTEEFTIDGTVLGDVPSCFCNFDGEDPNGVWRLYATSDGEGSGSLSGGWSITITTNQAPVVPDQGYTTPEDTPLVVGAPGLLAGATDPDGEPLTASLPPAPARPPGQFGTAHGVVSLQPDGSFTYTPNPDFHGTDQLTFFVTDPSGEPVAEGQVTFTVTPVNDPAVAVDDDAVIGPGETLTLDVTGNDFDVEGDPITVSSFGQPTHGQVDCDRSTCTYRPDPGFTGEDSFRYTVTDGNTPEAARTSATVTLFVAAGPTLPATGAAAGTGPLAAGGLALVGAGAGLLLMSGRLRRRAG